MVFFESLPTPTTIDRAQRTQEEADQAVDYKRRSQLAHYEPLPLPSSFDRLPPWRDPISPRQEPASACRYCRRRKMRCSGNEGTNTGRCSNCERFEQNCIFTPISAQTPSPALAHMVWRGAGQPPPMHGAYGQSLHPPTLNLVPQRIASPSSDLHSLPPNSRRSIPPIVTPHDTERGYRVTTRRPSSSSSTLHVDANDSQTPVDEVFRARLTEDKWIWRVMSKRRYSQNAKAREQSTDVNFSLTSSSTDINKQERDFAELINTRNGPPMTPLESMVDIEDRIPPSSIAEARNKMTTYHRKVSIPGNDAYQGNVETKVSGTVIGRSIANRLDTKKSGVSPKTKNETWPEELLEKTSPVETKITGTTIHSPPQRGGEPIDGNDASATKKYSTMKDDLSIHSLDSDLSYIPTPFDNATFGADGRFQDAKSQASASVETSERILNDLAIKMKQDLLDELSELAWKECENLPELIDGDASCSNTSSGADLNVSTSASSNNNSNTNRCDQKRQRSSNTEDDEGYSDSEDDNRDDNNKRKRERLSASDSPRRLKCPYYQRTPEKYTRAACRGRGFADMAKLKDHLKRVHSQLLRCTRCQEAMGSEKTYAEHLRQDNICLKRPETVDDRISAQLWPKLEFKKPPFSLQSSVEMKWRLMYKILFPGDREIPTPYDDRDISSRMEQLADAIEEELAKELEKALDPTISRLRGKLPSIIKRCKSRVLGIPNDNNDHRDAELLTDRVDNNSVKSSVDARDSGGTSNTEKGTSEEHSGKAVQSRVEISLNSSWTTPDTPSHESTPPQMPHGPSAKALGKRPQASMLIEDQMTEPPWSVMNTRDMLDAEIMHKTYDTADPNQNYSPENPAPAHSAKKFDHTLNMQDNSDLYTGDSFDLPDDWNVLTQEFEINQLIADWNKQEAAEVEKNNAWHCSSP